MCGWREPRPAGSCLARGHPCATRTVGTGNAVRWSSCVR
jgi:hypothetical protein